MARNAPTPQPRASALNSSLITTTASSISAVPNTRDRNCSATNVYGSGATALAPVSAV